MIEWLLVALVFGLAWLALLLVFLATLAMVEADDERMRAAIPDWDDLRRARVTPS